MLTSVGKILLGAGALLLAFVAFQLWGTSLYTNHEQGHLREALGKVIGHTSLPLAALGKQTHPGSDPAGSSLPTVATSVAATTSAPAVGQPIGLLAIPKLGLDDAIVEGVGEAQLQGGPGHYPGTSLPGQAGNAAIAGHRTTFAAPFYNLNQLEAGDPIFVLTSQGLFRYDVERTEIVPPDDNTVLDASTTPELTLTTCNPRYSASQRLVVVAFLDTTPAAKPHTGNPSTTKPAPKPTAKKSTGGAGASLAAATTSNSGDILPAVLWGLVTLIGFVLLRFGSRRLKRPLTWVSYVVGVPVLLAALFFCFEHVSLALPASF